MASQYHEAYWVTAATIAPLFTIAYLAFITRSMRISFLEGIKIKGKLGISIRLLSAMVALIFVVNSINMTEVFVNALTSLSHLHDRANLSEQTINLVEALVTLLVGAFMAVTVDIMLIEAKPKSKSDKKKRNQKDKHQSHGAPLSDNHAK